MTNTHSIPNNQYPIPHNQYPKDNFDLEERTIQFSKDIIDFVKQLSINIITKPLINQLIRSATGIGANDMEADEASSKRDFINKITITKKRN